MFIFRAAEGTQAEKPMTIEINGNTVYVRKNIKRITKETEQGEVKAWSYEEAQLTIAEYMQNKIALANNLQVAEAGEAQADAYAEILLGQADIAIAQQQQDDTLAEILLSVVTM